MAGGRAHPLLDLDEAVYVTKDKDGRLKLHQSVDLAAEGAMGGALWGALIRTLFFPIVGTILGGALGASTGALTGSLADYGIDDAFIEELGAQLRPGSSALFVLVRKATVDKVVPEVSKVGGTILRTSLTKELEDKLQAVLNQGSAPGTAAPVGTSTA